MFENGYQGAPEQDKTNAADILAGATSTTTIQVPEGDRTAVGFTPDALGTPWVVGPTKQPTHEEIFEVDNSAGNDLPPEVSAYTAPTAETPTTTSSAAPERTQLDAATFADQLQNFIAAGDIADAPATQLRAIKDITDLNRASLDMLAVGDAQVAENLKKLDAEWARREAQAGQAIVDLSGLQNPDAIVGVVQEGATIDSTERTSDGLVLTTKNPDGTEAKTTISLLDSAVGFATLYLLDALLGTRNAADLMQFTINQKIISPLMFNLGLDPDAINSFYDQFGSGEYLAMDNFIQSANTSYDSAMMGRFFDNSLNNGTLYTVLKGVNPIHRVKIFAPAGTQKFGSTGEAFSLAGDELSLAQDLVDKMRNSLTDAQRRELGIQSFTG